MTRPVVILLVAIAASAGFPVRAGAQDPPPKIGPFAIDVQGTIPRFPSSSQRLADSRGLSTRELPGAGRGAHATANLYFLTWRVVTFGIGADAAYARSHSSPPLLSTTETGRAVTETFGYVAPELSFNFGTGDGWSYLSGGIGQAQWAIVPDGELRGDPDRERLKTINYGGGARWFNTRHVAFSLDVRFYAVYPGVGSLGRPGGPRATLLFLGGGVSLK